MKDIIKERLVSMIAEQKKLSEKTKKEFAELKARNIKVENWKAKYEDLEKRLKALES